MALSTSDATSKRFGLEMVLVAQTVPYPPTNGANVDRWNRIVALSREGVSIHLITWEEEEITEDQVEALRTHAVSLRVHRRNRRLYLALHPKHATQAVSRVLPKGEYEAEVRRIKQISPDVAMLDGLAGGLFGLALARDLGIPLVYRAHNVEHKYLLRLAAAESNLVNRLKLLLNAPRAKLLENDVRDFSSLIYDISQEDRQAWRNHRSAFKAKVLPTYLHPDLGGTSATELDGPTDIDVLYVGNLHTPNNVFGLRWFAKEIVPSLEGLTIVVAGSKPTPEIRDLFRGPNVRIVANPREVWPLYARARAVVNPLWHGGGVNIKMIEALVSGKPVVSTPQGARGLSDRLLAHVSVADDAGSFARAVLNRRSDGFSARQREEVMEEHGWENVVALVGDLNRIADRTADSAPHA